MNAHMFAWVIFSGRGRRKQKVKARGVSSAMGQQCCPVLSRYAHICNYYIVRI